MKFGRNLSTWEIPKLKMSNYFGAEPLPEPPTTCRYSDKAEKSLSRVYLNDQYGDCVIAGGCHFRGVTSANAGTEVQFADRDVYKMYQIIGGGGDHGADLQTAMNYWKLTGFPDGVKILGWLAIDNMNPKLYRQAMWLFEGLYFGIQCPDVWFNPMPQSSGFTWDVAGRPVPKNGHCIQGVNYTEQGIEVATWGMVGLLTDAAIQKYCGRNAGGEMYAMISQDQIAKAQTKAPNGLNWHELITDFDALGGSLPVPPDLEPQPIRWEEII